jgi:hypothetical protein
MSNKLWTIISILLALGLFVVLSQPVWNSEKLIENFKSDCDKRGGVLLEHKKTFVTEYKCESYLGKE